MKKEYSLEDMFRNLKPTILLLQISNKPIDVANADYLFNIHKINKLSYKNWFFLTKPFTGITKKEAIKLWKSYIAIRALRNRNKTVEHKILYKNKERLWLLSSEKYQEIADRIYKREGKPNFGYRYIDGVAFGEPVTYFSNYVNKHSYSNQVLIERTIGVKPIQNLLNTWRLRPTIDVDSENLLKQRRR